MASPLCQPPFRSGASGPVILLTDNPWEPRYVVVQPAADSFQDFHTAFGLGPDNRHIATVDADGVALAAIQGLHREVRGLHSELGGLRDALKSKNQEIEELRHLLNEVPARLDRGEPPVRNRPAHGP